ncbi:MAG: carbohydrate binding family 9 domain-containing protein [Gammaproteobacteria bacterium]|nr:carbohydrate binding family 9 domain-containing protein [Gammaproteobacteria bacterium]
MGDAAWRSATPTTGFWQVQPQDGQPSTQRTDVYVGYTDTSLYIGVMAWDDDPGGIIVTDSRRDSSLDHTDAFLVVIDGLLDRQNGYVFGTNPAGIEYDGQVTKEGTGGDFGSGGGAFNRNWDGAWSVRAAITDDGWSAEFEIPFNTLRYGKSEVQNWGINFQRNIRRNNEIAYWAPLERNRDLFRVSRAGTLTGIAPPALRNLQFTPYVLGEAHSGGDLPDTETDADAGFDIKYGITPSLTLDLTYNTDFAQVEVDEQQVNLDRFNLFFPEKRPFFLENAGQFAVGNGEEVEMFFSRRIGIAADGSAIPVKGGTRLSGRIGERTNIGLLYMGTEAVQDVAPGNEFVVVRVNQELPNRSSIGAIFVNRDGDGSFEVAPENDYNRTWAVDGRWGIGEHILLSGWAARTATPGLDGRDDAFSLKADYSSASWAANASYTELGEDFNPEVGFLQRQEYRKAGAFIMRRIRPDDLWNLLEIRPHASYTGYWKLDDFQESGFLHLDTHWEFRTGTELHTGYNLTRAGVIEDFEIVPGVWVPADTYDHGEAQLVYLTDRSRPFSVRIRAVIGGQFGGDRTSISPTLRYRIGETFRTTLSINHNDYDLPYANGDFSVVVARLRLSYSFTPKIQLQALIQYNDADEVLGTNLRFFWLRTANSGLYLVYNEFDERFDGGGPTERSVILKYSHIFDVFD